jgi:hypothetical protein
MIPSLSRFDPRTAAGILARMALSIDDDANPAADVRIPDEGLVREQILRDVYRAVGASAEDVSIATRDRITDFLDSEGDRLINAGNFDAALRALGDKGELPSDLFDVIINDPIKQFCGKNFSKEERLINETVKKPDQEQHYGKPGNDNEPFLISLFAKYYPNKYPANSFTMLVTGQRNGQFLMVVQAVRIYHDIVALGGATTVLEMLKRFSEVFGADIEVNGEKGKFFSFEDYEGGFDPLLIRVTHDMKPNGKKQTFTTNVAQYIQTLPGSNRHRAAIVVAVDFERYRSFLEKKGWR